MIKKFRGPQGTRTLVARPKDVNATAAPAALKTRLSLTNRLVHVTNLQILDKQTLNSEMQSRLTAAFIHSLEKYDKNLWRPSAESNRHPEMKKYAITTNGIKSRAVTGRKPAAFA